MTREVVLLGSGVPKWSIPVSIPLVAPDTAVDVLDRYVWTVLGDECMDDGSFDQDIAAARSILM